MRFMLLVKASAESEAGVLPSAEMLAEMGRFNESLVDAGVLLAGDGLHPSSRGARVTFAARRPTVVDGPFSESKELVAGYWILQVKSREEAIEWARRAPFESGEIEVRQLFDAEDFAPSDPTGELREAEARLRQRAASQQG
jgi:hypothetical protein